MISDTSFLLDDMLYHFECRFSNDKEMAFRMFEYDFHTALSDAKRLERLDEFVFPKSCVVYVTPNKNNPKSLSMKIRFPNGEFLYEVPTVRVHDYTPAVISEKKLLIFLPYLVLCYPQKLKNRKPPTAEEIKKLYREMIDVLKTAYNDRVIDVWEYNMLLETVRKTEERVFHDYPEIKKEVDPVLANILNLESIKMWNEMEQQKREAEQQKREAVKGTITYMRQQGFAITDEQIQEILKRVMEQQKTEE